MYKSGSPYDRGSADRYYGRQFTPHCCRNEAGEYVNFLHGEIDTNLTDEEKAEYRKGWNEETGAKDWGGPAVDCEDQDCDEDED